ncbi:MAG: cysteine hydrolase [Desulfoplanes sp.]|nr:cysteine hydrolase [Desulfoplanes sp.]MDD4649270.1 cysteine hydrolase [Desulfoplanes sp.]
MKQALLIIDMLNDFVLEQGALEVPRTRAILSAVKQKLWEFRSRKQPVLYICDAHEPDDKEFERMGWPPHALAGTPGARVVDDLAPEVGEPVVFKQTYSGFFQTDLEMLLQKLEVQELVLVGCVTNICVLYTAADAVMRGYRVQVPVSCVADIIRADGEFALAQMKGILGVRLEK